MERRRREEGDEDLPGASAGPESARGGAGAFEASEVAGNPRRAAELVADLNICREELSTAEEALRTQVDALARSVANAERERTRYLELFDSAPDPYFVTDTAGVIREVNGAAAYILGVAPSRIAGKPLLVFVERNGHDAVMAALGKLEEAPACAVEVRLCTRAGELVWADLRARKRADGRVFWIARDVTERRREADALRGATRQLGEVVTARTIELERALRDQQELLERERALRAELEAANVAKDRFLAILSHDLRGPLNAVLGWTSLLRRERLDTTARERALATIERNARVQAELIEELLDLSRLTAGKLQLELRPLQLAPLVTSAVDAVTPLALEQGVTLSCDVGAADVRVVGDVGRLRQVLSNLLGNALKFTSPGGRIEVRLETGAGTARVVVADNGRGIRPELLPRVFDSYRQDERDGAASKGLGLGLFIVKNIVELHGGRVEAQSEGLGAGAVFTVTLPTQQRARSATPPPRPALPPGAVDLSDVRVLVVDDEDDTRELLAVMLERYGARVTTAPDAETALEIFTTYAPDVVVSDLGLPRLDGRGLARRLRETEEGRRIVMLAVSGYAALDDAREALGAGFDAHLAKPMTGAELAAVVARHVGRSPH